MYGYCGCYVPGTPTISEDTANQVRLKNYDTYIGQILVDQVIGLGGAFTIEVLSTDYNETRVTCPAAGDFDPTSGYITRETPYLDGEIAKHYTWYIIFIMDGNYAIPHGVPIGYSTEGLRFGAKMGETSTKIVYVNIQSSYSDAQVAAALAEAVDGIGFILPDYRGLFARSWDEGAGIDEDAATRSGRLDGVSGDHVGTTEIMDMQSHTHNLDVLSLWIDSLPVGGGLNRIEYVATGETEDAATAPVAGFSLFATGGNETRPKNVALAKIIKY
jgi:hypothetical protein